MKIAIGGWSLHREILVERKLTLLEFPRLCAEEFGIEAIELNSPFFVSTEPSYLDRLRQAVDEVEGTVVNIPVDRVGNLAERDDGVWAEGIRQLKEWFSIAKRLGALHIRVNTGRAELVDEAALRRVIEGYKRLAEEAERTGVRLLLENHGGISADPDNIVRIMKGVGSKYFGTCPDWGNFAPELRYEGLEKISSYMLLAHAKMYEFDSSGNETTIDVERCVEIHRVAGFDGYLAVEFEGKGGEREGLRKSIELLRRYI